MSFVPYKFTATDENGDIVPSAEVTVRQTSDSSLATIYSDNGVTSLTNPFNGDATTAEAEFYAAPDRYTITVVSGANTYTQTIDLVDARQNLTFATRAAFVSWVAGGGSAPDGAIANVGVSGLGVMDQYVASSGATDISDLGGWLPYGDPTPMHWGCSTASTLGTADSLPDDASKVQAAIDYCISANIGILHWPSGYIRLGSTVNVDGRLLIQGKGMFESFIHANHTTGAVVRFKDKISGSRDIGCTAGSTRLAASADGSLFGFQFEDDDQVDATANRMQYCRVENTYFYGHPDTHCYLVGPAITIIVDNCLFSTGKAHGIHFDRGTVSGRTNLSELIAYGTINDCRFSNLSGHTVATGTDVDAFSTPALRVLISNCEGGNNATDETATYADAAVYLRGANHEMRACGFAHPYAQVFVAGRNIHLKNNRILDNGIDNEFNPATAVDTGTDYITVSDHGFKNGYNVLYSNGGGTDIGGLTDNTEYYVINKTDDTFQLSATKGGAAINLTSTGSGTTHSLTSRGVFYTIGTYDELPTNGVYIEGVSIINPERSLEAIAMVTLPSGETTEPRNITVNYSETGNFDQVAATDDTMGSGGPNRVPGLRINGERPTLYVDTDQSVASTTTPTNITDLEYRIGANEKVGFEVILEHSGPTAGDLRFDMNTPSGATCRYGADNGMKVGASSTVIISGTEASATDIVVGSDPAQYLLTIRGYCLAGSSDGTLVPRFAQVSSDATNTTIHAGSHFRVFDMV